MDELTIDVSLEAAHMGLPAYAMEGDAALDLRAAIDVYLAPRARAAVSTGLMMAIPAGYACLILPRSGLALRHGISVLNTPGLIDPGYRGEVAVILVNLDETNGYQVCCGDRIAQLLVVPTTRISLRVVSELPPSARGQGGFGHTG